MVFSFSMFVGIFIFAESYPIMEGFYDSGFMGDITVYESLGLSAGIFTLALILMALGAFVMAHFVERKVKKVDY